MSLSKKIANFSLVVVALIPIIISVLMVVGGFLQRWMMVEALEQQECITITVNTDAVIWVDEEKEVLINNEMFDVKAYKINHNHTITLIGLYDKKEQELMVLAEKQSQQNHSTSIVIKWISQIWHNHNSSIHIKPLVQLVSKKEYYNANALRLPLNNKRIPDKPPQELS